MNTETDTGAATRTHRDPRSQRLASVFRSLAPNLMPSPTPKPSTRLRMATPSQIVSPFHEAQLGGRGGRSKKPSKPKSKPKPQTKQLPKSSPKASKLPVKPKKEKDPQKPQAEGAGDGDGSPIPNVIPPIQTNPNVQSRPQGQAVAVAAAAPQAQTARVLSQTRSREQVTAPETTTQTKRGEYSKVMNNQDLVNLIYEGFSSANAGRRMNCTFE